MLTLVVLLDLGVCCILSLSPLAIHECLCNGHKLLRQTLKIDFCLRRDLSEKRQPLEWRNHPHHPKEKKKKTRHKMNK